VCKGQALGFRVSGLEIGDTGSGFRVKGLDLGFWVKGFIFRVKGLVDGVQGFGCWVIEIKVKAFRCPV
jgi:hypothetical protein